MVSSRIRLWWERKRPGPLNILVPEMQWGRFVTWANAVLKRRELKRQRASAWETYAALLPRISVGSPFRPSDGLGRFAHHISHSGLPLPLRYLEIGAFDGNCVAYVYTLLNGKVSITVVDPFISYAEITDADYTEIFRTFSQNIRNVGAEHAVEVLKGSSFGELPKLIEAGRQFDIIYIDGSHATPDVMLDALLGWKLLTRHGLMIFDDYWYRRIDLGRGFRPKLAIDGFVGAMSHEIEILDVGRHVFIRKK